MMILNRKLDKGVPVLCLKRAHRSRVEKVMCSLSLAKLIVLLSNSLSSYCKTAFSVQKLLYENTHTQNKGIVIQERYICNSK